MKALSLALLFVAGTSAWACPDLTGNFACDNGDGTTSSVAITQAATAGITTFTINGSNFVADGQVATLPDEAGVKNQKISFSCEGTPVKYKDSYTADVYEAGAFQGTYASDYLFSKDTAGNLLIEDVGTFTAADGSVIPWTNVISCAAM